MKKLLFAALILTTGALSAQTLTQANHSYTVGVVYSTIPCNTVGITPGSTGAGSTWNFSSVTTVPTGSINYVSSVNTNTAYASADIVVDGGTNNKSYYKSTSTDMKYYGGDVSVNGTNVTLVYSSPAVYATYPMSLSTTNTGAISGSGVVMGNAATFSGNCSINADATGTITLPSGLSYTNTIRVVTSQTIVTSPLPFVGAATINMVNYDFYDPSTTYTASLFSIQTSTLSSGAGTSTQTFVTTIKDNNTSIKNNSTEEITVSVFPNPSVSSVNFETKHTDAFQVIMFDLTGKQIASEIMVNGKANADVSTLSNGTYLYTITDASKNSIAKGKFTVRK